MYRYSLKRCPVPRFHRYNSEEFLVRHLIRSSWLPVTKSEPTRRKGSCSWVLSQTWLRASLQCTFDPYKPGRFHCFPFVFQQVCFGGRFVFVWKAHVQSLQRLQRRWFVLVRWLHYWCCSFSKGLQLHVTLFCLLHWKTLVSQAHSSNSMRRANDKGSGTRQGNHEYWGREHSHNTTHFWTRRFKIHFLWNRWWQNWSSWFRQVKKRCAFNCDFNDLL